jgi:SAM-dependent MidA family methyltransferase
MPVQESRAILPHPPDDLKQHSDQLCARIKDRIRADGPIPFSAYMEMALYEPGLGYYSAGLEKFGAGGDFVTAPELGSLFARCLAQQAAQIGAEFGADWGILEIGAGSGRLTLDLLLELGAERAPARYRILERSGHLRAVQAKRFEAAPDWLKQRISWLDAPPDTPWQGLLLANEVIDALAVERFRITDGAIEQQLVGLQGDAFGWEHRPAPPAMAQRVGQLLGERLSEWPQGYCSEYLPSLPAWLGSITQTMQRGVALFIDYGYPRPAYYHPERHDGTLKCHYRQRMHGDPFAWPGLQDLTASVDFTALAEAALANELDCLGYASQALFLLGSGLAELSAGLEELPVQQRLEVSHEIRLLTLPGEMGEAFQAMALGRGWNNPLRGFALQDLRNRL